LKDLYILLGVSKTVPLDEIKKGYRILAKQFHPGLNLGSKEAEAKFKELNHAYEQLTIKANKREYL